MKWLAYTRSTWLDSEKLQLYGVAEGSCVSRMNSGVPMPAFPGPRLAQCSTCEEYDGIHDSETLPRQRCRINVMSLLLSSSLLLLLL